MKPLNLVLGALGGFAGAATVGFVGVLLSDARASAGEVAQLRVQVTALEARLAEEEAAALTGHGRPNVLTGFNPDLNLPRVSEGGYVDPMASLIGDVRLGRNVYVAPFASLRGDEGQPIAIGDESNVQDGVVIHALETVTGGQPVPGRTYTVDGQPFAVYIGNRVSMAHQSQVHGPARIDDDVFLGMQALVFKSWIGSGSVVEPGARLIGVTVAPGRYVPAGMVVSLQAQADKLPEITDQYAFKGLNEAVVHVNTSFADRYGRVARGRTGAAAADGKAAPQGEVAAHTTTPPPGGHPEP